MKLSPELEAACLKLAGQPPAGAPPAPRKPALVAPAFAFRLTLTVPLRVVSAANRREHWAAKHRRVRDERGAVRAAFSGANLPTPPDFAAVVVTLTRLGGRRWDDDNNVSGLKATRDAVAEWLRLDDGSDRVKFRYEQEPGGPAGVRIALETA